LFGGRRDGVYLDDFWAWNGASWIDLTSPSGPSARWDAKLAYDVVRDRLVLFGGSMSAGFDDTWEFDGVSWQQMTPQTTPDPRGTAITYDLVRQQCVLVTHAAIQGAPGRTWTWDGVDWTLVDSNGPDTGQGGAMAYDLGRDVSVYIGGHPVSDEIWEWNGSGWSQVGGLPPGGRYRPSLSYDPVQGAVQLFGGQPLFTFGFSTGTGPASTAAWTWDGQTLQPLHGELRPASRHNAMFAEDLSTGDLVVFGGTLGTTLFGDTWTFDGDRWHERQPATTPPARSGAVAVTELAAGRVLMFGGFAQGTFLGDLWSWDGNDWTQLMPAGPSPSPRQFAAMAFDPTTGSVLLFGGSTGPVWQSGGVSGDTWRWNGASWTQLPVTGPAPREQAAMMFDSATGDMLLWGGRDGATAADQMDDFWRFDGTSWQQIVTATVPPPLFYPSLFLDPSTGQIGLAGASPGTGNEFWSFDGVDWSQQQPPTDPLISGRTVLSTVRGNPLVYTGASLVERSWTPASVSSSGGACGARPPRLELRTRPRLGSTEFGFDVHTDNGDLVVIGVADATAALPLGACTLQLGGALWPTLHVVGPSAMAQQALPLS
ncbi:MAG: hypothetical protein KAI24_07680, partial [Planctomycetes bacterium]|nr:hypothetical protein [Planctomycetota bacterium]